MIFTKFFINFNPRSPHGERRLLIDNDSESTKISIHAPRMGSDLSILSELVIIHISIHAPRMGSDAAQRGDRLCCLISIHAPRMGSDKLPTITTRIISHFNPRSPHGERQVVCAVHGGRCDFNPRSPHGERPAWVKVHNFESDFNPRSPHGERRKRG